MKPVFDDDVVVDVGDDGVRSVRGMAPGPAGAASIDLADGVSLAVDFADPSVLCTIELEPAHADVRLDHLIGASRSKQALATEPQGRVVRLEGRRARHMLTSLPEERPAHELGVVASLASLADDPRRSPVARVASAAEVIESIADGVRGVADRAALLHRMTQVLLDQSAVGHGDAAALATNAPDLAQRLATLLDRLAATGIEVDTGLIGVLRSTSDRVVGQSSPAAATVEQLPGLVRVTIADGIGKWLRIADSSTMVLHAVVPFTASLDDNAEGRATTRSGIDAGDAGTSGGRVVDASLGWSGAWVAEAVVAPDLPPERVVVEITDDPAPVASSTLGRVQQAVALGRRAVEQAQAGHVERATSGWRDCAAAWRALGDETRAARADDYAARRARPGRPASLGERINTSFGASWSPGSH